MPDQSIFSYFAWPLFAVVVVVIFLWMFRDPIVRFIDRTKSVTKEGVRAYDDAQLSTRSPDALTEFLDGFHSPLFLETESDIDKTMQDRGVTDPADVRKALLKMLARAVIFGQFEGVQGSIFASQLTALQFLNEQAEPVPKATLKGHFYDKAVNDFAIWHANRTFDQWLEFLQRQTLVVDADAGVSISGRGVEFLKWRVGNRRVGPWFG